MAQRRESILLPYVIGMGPVADGVFPVRPLWQGASSRLMPQLTFGHRLGGAFAFMASDEARRASVQETALGNLAQVDAPWSETEFEGEDGQTYLALACQDNCATEKLLDSVFMIQAQRLLSAKRLIVGIPARTLMLVMDGGNDGAATMGFLALNLSFFRSGEGVPVTPALFRVKDGRIEGFFAEGLETYADEFEARLENGQPGDDLEDDDAELEDRGSMVAFATNAPPEWPLVEVPEVLLGDRQEIAMHVMATLDDGFDDDVEDLGASVFRMTEAGFVEIDTEIIEGERHSGLVVYDDATSSAAAHFYGVQAALREVNVHAVYYAPAELPVVGAAAVAVPFSPEILRLRALDPEPGAYATWWSVPGDESLLASETYRCIERVYVAMEGFEPMLFARFARALEMLDDPRKRVLPLPLEEQETFVRGPDARTLLFSASEEKGLLHAFPMKDTSLEWRNRFWRLYAHGIEAIAAGMERDGIVRKATRAPKPVGWLRVAARHCDEMVMEPGETRVFGLAEVG